MADKNNNHGGNTTKEKPGSKDVGRSITEKDNTQTSTKNEQQPDRNSNRADKHEFNEKGDPRGNTGPGGARGRDGNQVDQDEMHRQGSRGDK